jgi:hypothetical protein
MPGADNSLTMPVAFHLPRAIDQRTQDKYQIGSQAIPVSVTKIQGELVQVKSEAQGKFTIPSNMLYPQLFSAWVRQPTQVGDKGWLTPADYYLGGMSGDAGGVANYRNRGNLTPMVFVHISQKSFPTNPTRNLNQVFINGPQGVLMQTTDGNASINIGANNITIKFGNTQIVIDASSITMTASGTIAINGNPVDING